jgi:hypothetical protein
MIFCSPESPGAYFEARCKNPECQNKNRKFYYLIGSDKTFDYFEEMKKMQCSICTGLNVGVNNVGLFQCKWNFQGELEDSGPYQEPINYSIGYQICQNLKQRRWKWLQFSVFQLNSQEISEIQKKVNNSLNFDDDINNLQLNSQNSARFNEKNKQNLKKEAERKRDIIYYLKKNLKDQQKVIKKLSKKVKNLKNEV